jgi:hypothetical protein
MDNVEESRLVLLPKELRLQIWKHVLTESSKEKLTLRITQQLSVPCTSGKRFSNSLQKYTDASGFGTEFEYPPSSPITTSLLRTNLLLYTETLPCLYNSVRVCPWHQEGPFPLFLDTLSAFARSHIRYIILAVPVKGGPASTLFYWALLCAQPARLKDSLHQVEVRGESLSINDGFLEGVILNPILKTKTLKKFSRLELDAEFQRLLADAAKMMESKAAVRRVSTAADAEQRVGRQLACASHTQPVKTQKLAETVVRVEPTSCSVSPITDECDMAYVLRTLLGYERFD